MIIHPSLLLGLILILCLGFLVFYPIVSRMLANDHYFRFRKVNSNRGLKKNEEICFEHEKRKAKELRSRLQQKNPSFQYFN